MKEIFDGKIVNTLASNEFTKVRMKFTMLDCKFIFTEFQSTLSI